MLCTEPRGQHPSEHLSEWLSASERAERVSEGECSLSCCHYAQVTIPRITQAHMLTPSSVAAATLGSGSLGTLALGHWATGLLTGRYAGTGLLTWLSYGLLGHWATGLLTAGERAERVSEGECKRALGLVSRLPCPLCYQH